MTTPLAQPQVTHFPDTTPPYRLLDAQGQPIPEADLFLKDVQARHPRSTTVRTYAYALLDWYRYLSGQGLDVREARRSHIADYVLAIQHKVNPQRQRHAAESPAPGSVNPVTGKPHLSAGYRPGTINQRLVVIGQFYSVLQLEEGLPVVHPLKGLGRRPLPYRNPASSAKLPVFRQRQPEPIAYAMSQTLLDQVRGQATSHRDAALIEGLYCSAGRAAEIIAMNLGDVLWEKRQILLTTKGQSDKKPVAVSSKFLDLLQRYLDGRTGARSAHSPVWLMERGEERRMTYGALRAVIQRINAQLGTNLTLHNFRSTTATHLAQNPKVPLVSIQRHLRHQCFVSTQRYILLGRAEFGQPILDIEALLERPQQPKVAAPYDATVLARVMLRKGNE